MKILFVCTGNTCRSPMAQGIAEKIAEKKQLNHEFLSAGLFVNDVDGVAQNAVAAAAELGADISAYKPVQLTPELIDKADVIVPVTAAHKRRLLDLGVSESKIKTLAKDVLDPYMQNLDVYTRCANELYQYIEILLESLNDDKNFE